MTSKKLEDEEMEEFIEEFQKIVNRLEKVAPALEGKQHLRDKVNIFMSAYNQKQLAKATQQLFWATLVLAVATIMQLINSVYGRQAAINTITQIMDFVSIILIILLIIGILQTVFDVFAKIRKLFDKIRGK